MSHPSACCVGPARIERGAPRAHASAEIKTDHFLRSVAHRQMGVQWGRFRGQKGDSRLMPPILPFDVNETLLDLATLDPHFERNFGSAAVRKEWFTQALQLVFVSTLTGSSADFAKIFAAALQVVEARHQRSLSPEQRSTILETVSQLPAHHDVRDGLQR